MLENDKKAEDNVIKDVTWQHKYIGNLFKLKKRSDQRQKN